jgi:heptosyltransferase-1
VHALPVLPFIKSADPSVSIDWLVEEPFAPLLEGHPMIRRVHSMRTKAWRREGMTTMLAEGLRLIRRLREERFDLVLDLQGNSKSGFFTRLTGAPRRCGFDRRSVREWPNLLATTWRVPLGGDDHHISDRALALARAAFPKGSECRPAGPLAVGEEAAGRIEERLREFGLERQPLVVLHYGTTWETKLWPLDCWQQLATILCRDGRLRPVLTWGSDEERAAAEAIRAASGGQAIVWPRGSLMDLVALLDRADLVVGGDTGPIHIAAAVGTPTVSLYRVTDASRNGPRGNGHIRLQAPLDCSPCLRKECPRDPECGHSIAVEDVSRAVFSLLPGGSR